MTKVKESSTIQANKEIVFRECPVTYVTDRMAEWVVEDSKNNAREISKSLDNFPI